MNIPWDEYFLDQIPGTAVKSKDPSTKVAAIIVIKRLIPSLLFALTVYYCITVPTPQAIEFIDTVILFFQ